MFFLGFNLQMPDTEFRPTTWTPQIAIHIWIAFLLN